MTTKQKEKLELYREFGDKAKDAYKFIYSEEDEITVSSEETNEDGVYIIYKDGSYQKFDGSNPKENVLKIGVKMGSHSLAISLNQIDEEFSLMCERDEYKSHKEIYTEGRILAQEDFNGKSNTEYLKEFGCNVPLEDGEYIPACGEMMIIAMNFTSVNEALAYVGGDTFLKDYYWTSSSLSAANAWALHLNSGYLHAHNKVSNSLCVRPVSAFEINASTL